MPILIYICAVEYLLDVGIIDVLTEVISHAAQFLPSDIPITIKIKELETPFQLCTAVDGSWRPCEGESDELLEVHASTVVTVELAQHLVDHLRVGGVPHLLERSGELLGVDST